MKVAYISTYPPEKCGIASYMSSYLSSIKNKIDDHLIISNNTYESSDGIFRCLDQRNFLTMNDALTKLDEYKPDVVHVQYISTFFQPWMPLLINLINYPVLAEAHEVLFYPESKHMSTLRKYALLYYEKLVYRNVSKIVVHNGIMRERLIRYYKVPENKISVIPLGINTDVDYKKDYGLSNKLLFYGYIHWDKGIRTLIEAFRSIQSSHPDMELILMGGSRSQECIDYIKEMKAKYKLNIMLTGYVENIGRYMRECDMLIIPHVELSSSSLAVTEAMPYGIPIIASDVAGLKDQIEHGKTGLLFKVNSSTDLENKIVELGLIHNQVEREFLGRNARKHAIRELSMDVVSNKFLTVYKELG